MNVIEARDRWASLRDLTQERAIEALQEIHDILWPPENPNEDWDANTLDEVGTIIEGLVKP